MKNKVAMIVINAFTHDTRVQKEAKTLVKEGFDVTVFALHKNTLPEFEYQNNFKVKRIALSSLAWGKHFFILAIKYLEFIFRLTHFIIRLRPSVVHAHDVYALVPGFLAARLTRSTLIYDAHELWAERQAPLLKNKTLRRLIKIVEGALARRSDGVITVNPAIAHHLAVIHKIPFPVVLMHCQEYIPANRNNVLQKELGISEDLFIVIYAGNISPGRGLEKLVESAAYLDNIVIVIMGKDNMNGQIQQMVQRRNLQDKIFIRAPVPLDDVLRYVASADIGVVPTQSIDLSYHYEAGNKLFHYIMAGIPSAVSNQPEKRRIVDTHGVGMVFDQKDPKDMANKIHHMLTDKKLYNTMCRNARNAARDELNWSVESQKLTRLYTQLTSFEKE